MNDIRFAFRQLCRAPGFTAVAVLTLALGLTVNATLFTIANDLFFRPLPAFRPEQLVLIAQTSPVIGYQVPISYPDAQDLRHMVDGSEGTPSDMAGVYSGLMAYSEELVSLGISGRSPERTWVHATTDNYFSLLGVQPHRGRFLLPEDTRAPGGDAVMVLTFETWRTRFGSDDTVVGRTVTLNGIRFLIVGIAPQGFYGASFGTALSGFVPVTMRTRLLPGGQYYALNRGNTAVFAMARLREGISLEQAQAATAVGYSRLVRQYPQNFLSEARAVVMRETNSRPSPYVAQYAPKILAGISVLACLVLLVAIANVASLLYARSVSRVRELAIRSSVGASRFQLLRILLAESVLLALAAGVIGAVTSLWLSPIINTFAPSATAPAAEVPADWKPLFITTLLSLVVGLVAGLIPALRASGRAPLLAMKTSGTSVTVGRHPLRSVLIVGQIALSCVVLSAAALALRSLHLLSRQQTGYQTKNVVMASYDLDLQNYTVERGQGFHRRVLEQIRSLPGVESASLTSNPPLDPRINSRGSVAAEGETEAASADKRPVSYVISEQHYLSTIGLAIQSGRDFTDQDRFGSKRVALINSALGTKLFGNKDPIGRTFSNQGERTEVIGVLADSRYCRLTDSTQPLLIDVLDQNYRGKVTLVARCAGAPDAVLQRIRQCFHELDPELPLFEVQTLQQHLNRSPAGLMPYRMGALMAGSQGAIALLLAAIGIFGLIAFTVAQRTREIGIRIALGASRARVLRTVAAESIVLTVIGVAIGLVLSVILRRMLGGLLAGAESGSVFTFASVALTIVLTATIACWLPARRATRVNPIEALRAE